MKCTVYKVQNVGKTNTLFSVRLNNYKKDGNNPKSIPVD